MNYIWLSVLQCAGIINRFLSLLVAVY